jgi:AraC-like DNA-binding protein
VPATILSALYLLAIGQGLFLAIALLAASEKAPRTANRLLAALLAISSAIILHAWLGVQGLYASYPHSIGAIWTLGLLVGPLLYLYFGSLLFDRPLGRRAWLHFLPFILATVALLPFYLQAGEAKLAWSLARGRAHWIAALAAPAKLVIFLAYVAASERLMRTAAPGALLEGLRRLMAIWLVGGVLSVAALGIEFFEVALPLASDDIGAIALLCFVYGTAVLAMRLPLGYKPQAEPAAAPKPRYADKLLPEADRVRYLAALAAAMEEAHAYRDGELKLEQLAGQVAMTAHELSQLINDACGVNFQDYLNRYRVEDLKRALHAEASAGDSILELALAAGFNSKSALNRAFKKHTGMTPSQFRAQKAG